MDQNRRQHLRGLGVGALAVSGLFPVSPARAADAASFPSKPVTLIVPNVPGGAIDLLARLLERQLNERWGQPVLVVYKPGAGTVLGTDFVAKSPPDGYTLGMAITAFTINPALQASLPYDTRRDLVGVAQVAQAHFGLFAHPSLPASTVPELIAYAQQHPDALSYATPGAGTGTHLAGEMLAHQTGIRMVHVPYKGSAAAQQDVIGGRVPLLFDVLFSSMPFVKDGRMKVIALSSPRRATSDPSIPLIAETLPGFSAMSSIGVIAPAGLPPALLERISRDIGQAVRTPEMSGRMTQLGMEPVGSSAAQYNARIREDLDTWARVVKTAGIKPE